MNRPVLLAALAVSGLLAGPAAHAQRMSKLSGGKLAQICASSKGKEVCEGYISGVADGIAGIEHQTDRADATAFKGATCIPNDTTVAALRSTVVDYLRAHPDMAGKPAAVPTYESLHAAYPCKS